MSDDTCGCVACGCVEAEPPKKTIRYVNITPTLNQIMGRQQACIEDLVGLIGYLPQALQVLEKHGLSRQDTRQVKT
jgi:hypothetical protein